MPNLRQRLGAPEAEAPQPRVATAAEALTEAPDSNTAVSAPPDPAPPSTLPVPAPAAPGVPAAPAGGAGLSGKFDETDWVIPSLLLVQPTSQLGLDLPVGDLAMRDGRHWPELRVVLLSIAATRTYFPKEASESLRPYCSSVDRVVGRPFEGFTPYDIQTNPPGEGFYLCERCPHYEDQPWDLDEGCYRGYAVLMALVDNEDELVIMRVKGTSVGPFKQKILSLFRPRPRTMVVPDTWDYVFDLSAELVEEPGRKYCRLVPVMVGFNPEKESYRDLAASIAPQLPATWAAEEEPEPIEPDEELPFQ